MSRLRLHLAAAAVAIGLAGTAGCASSTRPTVNVLSVRPATSAKRSIVYVEVVNPAARPIKLQKLQYTFAASGGPAARGVVELGARLVAAGAAVVVEVPLDEGVFPAGQLVTLAGKLWAEQDTIVRSFEVEAELEPR